ncbi:MAG TPA: MFS transporter [Roseiflexaceae bacterium]|nr:MFS transporter [Roseiflexaceae bacterium]
MSTATLPPEEIVQRHARRNFLLNVLDGGAFFFGLSMVSRYTVLPLLVERLSGERWMQGLIPTIMYAGWFLPSLLMAPIVAARARRKPMLMGATLFERLPFLVLGLILLLAPDTPPAILLTLFMGLYIIHAFAAGVAGIPWQDFISRIIPQRRWGIFFGTQSGLGGALGVGGAAIATFILATQPFPQSIGMLSLFCFAAMVVSFCFLAGTIEPAMPPGERQTIGVFLRSIGPLLRRDTDFRWYLISRAAISLGLAGHSFLTAAALERFDLPDADVGTFTAVLLGAQAVANFGLGALADRWGHKQVLVFSAGIGLAALVIGVVAPTSAWYVPIFILVGAAQAGYQLSGFTLVLGFAPPAERAIYIGVANSVLAPLAVAGPLLCGWFAAITSYESLFVALTLIGIAGILSLQLRVRVPLAR